MSHAPETSLYRENAAVADLTLSSRFQLRQGLERTDESAETSEVRVMNARAPTLRAPYYPALNRTEHLMLQIS